MTQKELAYVEDAIGHENNIIQILNETINYLDDPNLVSFIQNEMDEHATQKQELMSFLEVKVNE